MARLSGIRDAVPLLSPEALARLAAEREQVGDGSQLAAADVARLAGLWRPQVHPPASGEEPFDLLDRAGRPTGVTAPRWLCHLLGLCHRTVHLVLRTPQDLLVLQVRSRHVDWPGCLDLAVTGHVRAGLEWGQAAQQEALEELGLDVAPAAGHLAPPGLQPVGTPYRRREVDSDNPPVFTCHLTRIHAGTLTAAGMAALRFLDGEVAALYLCGEAEARRLLDEERHRLAPGLVQSLPRYLQAR